MAETLEIIALRERVEQLETEMMNLKESMNSAVNTMMSKIDVVLQRMNIPFTPTPNAAAATSQVSLESSNSEGNGSVLQAARAGRWDIANFLLERGMSATDCQWAVESALVLAARAGQVDAVRRLLRRGAASQALQVQWGLLLAKSAAVVRVFGEEVPDAVRGKDGEAAMRQAAYDGRLEPLAALLDLGVDINYKDIQGITALMYAACRGHIACVKELLRRSADVSIQDINGYTALHRAALGDREDCVRALLEAGASRAVKNNIGETPLEVTTSEAIRRLFNIVH